MSTQNLNTAQTDDHGLDNWRELHIDQQPTWSEHEDFASTIAELNSVPPLVFAGEVDAMRQALGEVAEGRAFLLQVATAQKPSRVQPPTRSPAA